MTREECNFAYYGICIDGDCNNCPYEPKPIGECIECKYYEDIDNKVGACVYKNSLPNAEDNACVHFERRADEHTD